MGVGCAPSWGALPKWASLSLRNFPRSEQAPPHVINIRGLHLHHQFTICYKYAFSVLSFPRVLSPRGTVNFDSMNQALATSPETPLQWPTILINYPTERKKEFSCYHH